MRAKIAHIGTETKNKTGQFRKFRLFFAYFREIQKQKMQTAFYQPVHGGAVRELKEFWRGFFAHLGAHFVPHHSNNYHPHIFSNRMTVMLSALLLCAKIFTLAALSLGPAMTAFSSELTPANIIALTNASRQAFGSGLVSENSRLAQAAQNKAEDMLKGQYFSHNSPQGQTPWDFIRASGYQYLLAGENLAVNFTDAESVEQAWMNSPSHKANLLNKNYEEVGIGIAKGEYRGRQATFVVQMFGDPAEQKIKLAAAPTKVQAKGLPKPALPAAKGLDIAEASITPDGELMKIFARTEGDAVKVLAKFGEKAFMLNPGRGDTWWGYVEAAKLSGSEAQLEIVAANLFGEKKNYRVASFSRSLENNFNVLGASQAAATVKLFGNAYAPKEAENKFYLWLATAMLASLAAAIAIRHRIQHASLVMNGSLVVVLAMLLWMAG